MSSADAMKAREKLNGTVVDGRKIEVLELYQAFVFFFFQVIFFSVLFSRLLIQTTDVNP